MHFAIISQLYLRRNDVAGSGSCLLDLGPEMLDSTLSDLPPRDEGMFQRLGRRAPLLRIKVQAFVQQVQEEVELFLLPIIHLLALSDEPRPQVPYWLLEVDHPGRDPAGNLVFFDALEIQQVVEVHVGQSSAAEKLLWEFGPTFHDRPEHGVVVAACEEDLTRVELEKGTANRPYINGGVGWDSKDDLGGPVEARHKVGRRDVLFDR